jgi:hypothetical protein
MSDVGVPSRNWLGIWSIVCVLAAILFLMIGIGLSLKVTDQLGLIAPSAPEAGQASH